jgi:hypothetical protein
MLIDHHTIRVLEGIALVIGIGYWISKWERVDPKETERRIAEDKMSAERAVLRDRLDNEYAQRRDGQPRE